MREAADALVDARGELASIVRKAGSIEALDATLKGWHPNTDSWEQLGDSIFIPAVMSDLAGQLMVRGSEAHTIQLDDKDKPPFLDLPWDEAIAEFKARGILKPTELSTLLKDYGQRADKARQLMLAQVQGFVRTELEKSLTEGGTFKQFAQRIDEGGATFGISADDPAYLNMVFRTNVQSAYGAGRYRAMTDPDVMDERPYSELRTAGDGRVREEHEAGEGTVTLIGSPAFRLCSCPLGFSCRCCQVTLTRDELAGRHVIEDVADLPAGFKPTPGFEGPPVAKINALTPKLAPVLQQKPLPVPNVPIASPVVAPAAVAEPKRAEPKVEAPVPPSKTLPTAPAPERKPKTLPVAKQPKPVPAAAAEPEAAPTKQEPPSVRLGPNAEKVFGKQLSDKDIDELVGQNAKLPDGYSVKVILHDLDVSVSGDIRDASGVSVGSFHRIFERKNGELIVHHNYLQLQDSEQGKGIGAAIFNAQVDSYEKHGVAKVELAAASVGKYAWTKAGFDWHADEDFGDGAIDHFVRAKDWLKEDLRALGLSAKATTKILTNVKTPQDLSRVEYKGEKVGKSVLLSYDEIIQMSQTPAKIKRL